MLRTLTFRPSKLLQRGNALNLFFFNEEFDLPVQLVDNLPNYRRFLSFSNGFLFCAVGVK